MNLSTIAFTAVLRNTCKGCLCEYERMTACRAMSERAKSHGLPDCDEGHIYIASDGELFGMVQQSGEKVAVTTESPVHE